MKPLPLSSMLLVAVSACSPRAGDQPVTRTIALNSLPVAEAAGLLEPYAKVLGASERSATITVLGNEAEMASVERILEEYDRPQSDCVLRFQIIEADGFTGSDSSIVDVESALRGLFTFRGYRLTAEAMVRSSPNAHIRQSVVGRDGTTYAINGNVGRIGRRADNVPSTELQLELWVDGATRALQTSVNVPSGQTVVLGTARPRGDRPALILVVRPEVTGG